VNVTVINETVNLLVTLGVRSNLLGFKYLEKAIEYGFDGSPVQGLYSKVSEVYNTSRNCVERNIRYAVEDAFNRMDEVTKIEYFGGMLDKSTRKVSSTEFITILIQRVRMEVLNDRGNESELGEGLQTQT
jgi:hypothetical protein